VADHGPDQVCGLHPGASSRQAARCYSGIGPPSRSRRSTGPVTAGPFRRFSSSGS